MTKKPESKAVHRKTASFQPVAKGARPSTNNAEPAAPVLTVSSKKPAHKRQASGKTARTLTEKPVSNMQQSRQPLFQARREKDVASAKQQAMLQTPVQAAKDPVQRAEVSKFNTTAKKELGTDKKQQLLTGSAAKRTLNMRDYKRFKYVSNIHDKYEMGEVLGQGAFGKVLRCTHKDSGSRFAIKVMEKTKVRERRVYVQLLENELSILGCKSHPKIIRVIDLLEDKLNYYIVSEVVEGGELFKRLCLLESFTEDQAAEIAQQIMLGLNYLHLQSITHRDMKPENVLLVSKDLDNFDIKISDLGFAQKFEKGGKGMTLVLGSPLYMAPELVNRQPYTEKVDVWSLGVIVYQLLSGRTPFESDSIKKIDYNINHKKVTFETTKRENWSDVSPEAKQFIGRCLERDPTKRPSVRELFREPWIANYLARVSERCLDAEREEVSQSIKKNLIQYRCLNKFQKVVLSLVSGLCVSPEELAQLQEEFIRLDADNKGTLSRDDIRRISESEFGRKYAAKRKIDWEEVIDECDIDGDGEIDFQDFVAACLDRKALVKTSQIRKAFRIIDADKDGAVSLGDLQKVFHSSEKSQRCRIDKEFWEQMLNEAAKSKVGLLRDDVDDELRVSFEQFQSTMQAMIRKSWLRKDDRSPSHSPAKLAAASRYCSESPSRSGSYSPASRLSLRKKKSSDIGLDIRKIKVEVEEAESPARDRNLISPQRGNHFNEAYEEPDSPLKKFRLHEVELNLTKKESSDALREARTPVKLLRV